MKSYSQQSSVTKVLTGIQGFDEITGGGLPLGPDDPGDGRTGMRKDGVRAAVAGHRHRLRKEAGIFVAFEESTRQIVANAATFGWDLPTLEKKKLFFLDAQLSPQVVKTGEFDLVGMLSVLEAKAKEIHATHRLRRARRAARPAG